MFTLFGMILDTAFGIILAVVLCLGVVIYLVGSIRLFKKCGKEGWKAIIPFYSNYVFTCEICGLHWAWFVATLLIDLAVIEEGSIAVLLRFFVKAMAFYNLALKGHKETTPALIFGALFPEIVTCIYGFGSYEYDSYIDVKKSGLF